MRIIRETKLKIQPITIFFRTHSGLHFLLLKQKGTVYRALGLE
jgi:hypothetical protein